MPGRSCPTARPAAAGTRSGQFRRRLVDGRAALRVVTKKSESIRLRQFIEVVPEAAYTCAVWIKGKGTVTLHPSAQTPAVGQDLGAANGQATANWTRVQLPVKIGYHRHVASLHIDVGENADVLLRGAEFSAPLPAGPLPEDLVTAKPGRDADTLYFEDFDGTSCSFDVGKDCKLTADNGGRFGRGLLVTPTAGGAKARLHFGKLPETGTIEFWYKPAALPEATYDFNRADDRAGPDDADGLQAVDLCLHRLVTPRCVSASRRSSGTTGIHRPPAWVWGTMAGETGSRESGITWRAPGTARPCGCTSTGNWRGSASRAARTPSGVASPRTWNGPMGKRWNWSCPPRAWSTRFAISKCLRFGPFVPEGAKNSSFVMEQDASNSLQAAAGGPHLETSDKDLNAARLKTISKVPDVQAAYVFNASQAKPAWEGMAGMKLTKDYFGAGADGVELDGNQESDRPEHDLLEADGHRAGQVLSRPVAGDAGETMGLGAHRSARFASIGRRNC